MRYENFLSDIKEIRKELNEAKKLYDSHNWTVLDVTNTGVEESAAKILEVLELQQGFQHPMLNSSRDINIL